MSIFQLFKFKKPKEPEALDLSWMHTDMHSHLIPGIDDGSRTLEESIELVRRLHDYGLKKLIITPHIMSEFYRNSPETILKGFTELQEAVKRENISITLEAGAEYYLDEVFFEKVESNERLLSFGKNMVLVETGFMSKPHLLLETFFRMEMAGYQPVFAHPERYLYLHHDAALLESLAERNVYFQLNLLSLTGYYSKPVKKFAEKIIDMGLVRLVGTDCHNHRYLDVLNTLPRANYFKKLITLDLLNPGI